ncbi:hypothetical protein ACFYT4_28060 [Streptomyces sp. NPDC004609]|uniref:hypothetical protein n=1 Tax=Streptomyces sp. NPDC004609 TaxID=3364704 RepID=UPI00368772B9
MRHARAVAVFGIVLITLTGARGSGGGGCKSDSDSSSSSSSSSSGGSSPGGSIGGSRSHNAANDVTIVSCGLDATGKNLTARVTVNNPDAEAYNYVVNMEFKGDLADIDVTSAFATLTTKVEANASASAEGSTAYTGTKDGSEYKKCEVTSATRTKV